MTGGFFCVLRRLVSLWVGGDGSRPLVLKFGGELLEDRASGDGRGAVKALAARTAIVIVHGGGKGNRRALKVAGLESGRSMAAHH